MDRMASPARGEVSRMLPVVLLLFVGSGCAALIYEIVWLQLLQLVIGSSAVSLGVLLGTFMGGMCLGSLLLPRLVSARRHPLRVYALLELGIGAIGLVVLFGMPYVGRCLCRRPVQGSLGILLRGVVAAVVPAAADAADGRDAAGDRALGRERRREGVRGWDSSTAATSPGRCSAACWPASICCGCTTWPRPPTSPSAINRGRRRGRAVPRATAPSKAHRCQRSRAQAADGRPRRGGASMSRSRSRALRAGRRSGLDAAAVAAPRRHGLHVLDHPGRVPDRPGDRQQLGSVLGPRSRSPRVALGMCQMLLAAAIAWTAYMLAESLPFWPIDPSLPRTPGTTSSSTWCAVLWAVLPAAFLWGAGFPSLGGCGMGPRGRRLPARLVIRLVGGVYAANTVGAIVGALAFSMLLVGWIGTQQSQQMLIVVAAASP